MVLVGGYEDSLRRLGVQSWQRDGDSNSMGGRLSAPSYHFDMLQDLDRNRAYRLGIEATVEEGDLVVDIGTGSGLLSILAKRAGAEHCFAIEGDPALQAASKAVIAANGLSEDITVIPKHSTMVTCGFGLDVPYPAHVIVTEIFDSFLLGEGMLPSIIDAKERCLLAPDGGKVVPAGAQMHCLLVESAFLAAGESLPDASLFGMTEELRKSEGPAPMWSGPDPIQIHAGTLLSRGLASPLAQPFHGLDYDFDRPSTGLRRTARVKVETDGTAHGVMIWWDMRMSRGGDAAILSTAPPQYPNPACVSLSPPCDGLVQDGSSSKTSPPPDREHWRQAACMFPTAVHVRAGEELLITCGVSPDGLAPRFAVGECESPMEGQSESPLRFPSLRRPHLWSLSSESRALAFTQAAECLFKARGVGGGTVLCIGDGPLLPLVLGRRAAAAEGSNFKIISLQSSCSASCLSRSIISAAGLESVVRVLDILQVGESFEGTHTQALVRAAKAALGGVKPWLVAGEPCYHAMAVTGAGGAWQLDEVVRFCEEVEALRSEGLLEDGCRSIPERARLMSLPVQSEELWRRRRGALGDAEGADLSAFNSFRPYAPPPTAGAPVPFQSPDVVEWMPWDGVVKPLCSVPSSVLTLSPLGEANAVGGTRIPVESDGVCHAVALWVEIELVGGREGCVLDGSAKVSPGASQAVWMMPVPKDVSGAGNVVMVTPSVAGGRGVGGAGEGGGGGGIRLSCEVVEK